MSKLIKMDFRRMSRSTLFRVSLIVIAVLNVITEIAFPIISRVVPEMEEGNSVLSEMIANPFGIPMIIVLLFMSVVSFAYADFAGGFIKNIAGQVKSRSSLVISKFIVIGIHNFIFLLVGTLTRVFGGFIGIAFGTAFEVDSLVPAALATFCIKWMLSMAISAILLFVTNGVRNKTLASIVGVIVGTGALGLVYYGLSTALQNIFKIGISISDYMPDQLISSVSVGSNVAVANAIVVSIICSLVFLLLAIKVFKSRDIK